MCFYIKKMEKTMAEASLNTPVMKPSADFSLKCVLIMWIFYRKLFQ